MISAGERKGRTIGLKFMVWHSVHLLLPHNKVAQNKKAYQANNFVIIKPIRFCHVLTINSY